MTGDFLTQCVYPVNLLIDGGSPQVELPHIDPDAASSKLALMNSHW